MTDRGTFLTWYGTVGAANADRAVIARIGGREYTRRLSDRVTRHQPIVLSELDRWIAQDAASLAAGESYLRHHYHEPYSWTDTEDREHHNAANVSGPDHVYSRRGYSTTLPESAFDWPIYRWAAAWEVCRNLGYDDEVIADLMRRPSDG